MHPILLWFLIAFGFASDGFSQSGWQTLTTNTTKNLIKLQCYAQDTLFVFGANGTVLRSVNAGTDFDEFHPPTTTALLSGFFATMENGFTPSGYGTLYQTSNGGQNWTTNLNCGCMIKSICFSTPLVGLYTGDLGVYRTDNGGVSWSTNPVLEWVWPGQIIALNSTTFFLSKSNIVFKSTDAGATFQSDTLDYGSNSPITSISFVDENLGYLSTGDGKILKTTDQGGTWTYVGTTWNSTRDIVFIDELHGYAITGNMKDVVRHTNNGGQDWPIDYNSPQPLDDLEFDGRSVYAAGDIGLILKNEIWSVSIEEKESDAFSIYPNPCNDFLYVTHAANAESVLLYSASGNFIRALELKENQDFDLSDLAPGFYFIRVESGQHSSMCFSKM